MLEKPSLKFPSVDRTFYSEDLLICSLCVQLQVLHRRQKTAPGSLKIRDVNDLLDRLAGAQDK